MSENISPRQLKFSVYMTADGNYHLGGWRLPDAYADAGQNISRWIEVARILERGKIDMLFIADNISPQGVDHLPSMSRSPRSVGLRTADPAIGAVNRDNPAWLGCDLGNDLE
jgi:hypothetical protein